MSKTAVHQSVFNGCSRQFQGHQRLKVDRLRMPIRAISDVGTCAGEGVAGAAAKDLTYSLMG